MRIECLHGYFKFEETAAGQVSQFANLFSLDLARLGDHFGFADLEDAPDYSIVGGTFLGAPCTVNFEGSPWEVMRQNRLVYDFTKGLVVSIDTVTQHISVIQTGFYYVAPGLILPGSVTDTGAKVTDYVAHFDTTPNRFRYSEVSYE